MPDVSTILAILGGISPILLVVVTAYMKRRGDEAIAAKTDAEARVQDALVVKTRQETAGFVIDHAARLVDEFREYQTEKDQLAAEKVAAAGAEIRNLKGRVGAMEDAFNRLRTVMATHGVWDAAALVELRTTREDFPEPPPLPKSLGRGLGWKPLYDDEDDEGPRAIDSF